MLWDIAARLTGLRPTGTGPLVARRVPLWRRPRFLVILRARRGRSTLTIEGTGVPACRLGPGPAACIVAVRSLPGLRHLDLTWARGDPPPTLWATSHPARLRRKLGHARRCAPEAQALTCLGRDPLWSGFGDLPTPPTEAAPPSAFYDEAVALAALQLAAEDPRPFDDPAPMLSFVVPVFETPTRYLDDLLASVRRQAGAPIELVLSDDGSMAAATRAWLAAHADMPGLTILRHAQNRGIAAATNAGIAAARGTWIGFVDHDDALAPDATALLARAIRAHPDALFIYTDEAITDDRLRPRGFAFKPAYDPVLLSGVNYINHLSLVRRDRLLACGGLRDGFQGSQDYELLLRYLAGVATKNIIHVPYPAYLWRRGKGSFSATSGATAAQHARHALELHYAAPVEPAGDLHRLRFDLAQTHWPRVSIIIPNRDAFPLISRLLADLTQRTDYPDIEIIIIDNGTRDPRTLALYRDLQQQRRAVHVEIEPAPFNFARAINAGRRRACGAYVLLLNNDIEIPEPNWLREMVACFAYRDVGIVGARLLYPDRTIQHAGVIVGLGGLAGHWHLGAAADHPGPQGRLGVRQSLSAVTGACLLISAACADAVGPLDETLFAIAYNDVDLCLRAIACGYRIVWTPFSTLIHHESATRGSDETPENLPRFRREQDNLRIRHATATFEDRAFSPWYARGRSDPHVILPSRLPDPR